MVGKGIDPAFIRAKAIQRGLLTEESARRKAAGNEIGGCLRRDHAGGDFEC